MELYPCQVASFLHFSTWPLQFCVFYCILRLHIHYLPSLASLHELQACHTVLSIICSLWSLYSFKAHTTWVIFFTLPCLDLTRNADLAPCISWSLFWPWGNSLKNKILNDTNSFLITANVSGPADQLISS